jgi:hypothetical protein
MDRVAEAIEAWVIVKPNQVIIDQDHSCSNYHLL